MKKQFRILTALVMLFVFSAVFAMPAAAQESGSAEENWMYWVNNNGLDELKTIFEIQEKSLTSGIEAVALGESHCAVLFDDGTVTAFQSAGFGQCPDLGECDTADWSGIKEIACRAECTFGLKEDGSIVWAGMPEYGGFDYGWDSLDDDWKKITEGKNYVDIACIPYGPLFALNTDGTVDRAFTHRYDGVMELTNVIDIEYYRGDWGNDRCYFAALASDGTVSLFSDSSYEPPVIIPCEGAQKLCVWEGRLCVLMDNGDVQYLAQPGPGYYQNAIEAAFIDKLQSLGTVSDIWSPLGNTFDGVSSIKKYIVRMDKGDIYWVQGYYVINDIGSSVDSVSFDVIAIDWQPAWNWKDLQDAYLTAIDLPASADDGNRFQKLEIILGVMEDGTLNVRYSVPMYPRW